MQILVTFFLSALAILALTHALALEFFLYWKYLWLDIPMHILGGVCVALGYAILPFFGVRLPKKYTTYGIYLLVVFIVGIGWEIFEYINGISLTREESFVSDTIMDLVLDGVGGTLGYFIMTRFKDL